MEQQPELLVALTGYGQEKDRESVLAAGFDMHLVKPISPEEIVDAINSALHPQEVS